MIKFVIWAFIYNWKVVLKGGNSLYINTITVDPAFPKWVQVDSQDIAKLCSLIPIGHRTMFQHVSNNSWDLSIGHQGQWGDANVTSAIFHGVMFATIDESLLGVADRLSHEIDPGLELVVNIRLVLHFVHFVHSLVVYCIQRPIQPW